MKHLTDKLVVRFDIAGSDAALLRAALQLDRRSLRNFIVHHAIRAAEALLHADRDGKQKIVLKALEQGSASAEDVRIVTGIPKPLVQLCLNELEAMDLVYSTTGKGNSGEGSGNRKTFWYIGSAPKLLSRKVNEDFE
jgi:uncharacterized protein (DUF1778 family)